MDMFEQIIGNEQIKKYLMRMVRKEAIGNSLLFAGPDGVGKSLFARAFARLLIQDPRVEKDRHPDVHHYYPEGKIGMHTIDSMRRFTEEVYLAPFEAKWKVFIIHDAERMLSYSANALLKTFEEPADDAVILLLSSKSMRLLPTVLSRCRTVHFQQVSFEEMTGYIASKWQVDKDHAKEIAARSQGSIGHAHRLMSKEDDTRDLILNILAQRNLRYGDLMDLIGMVSKKVGGSQEEYAQTLRQELTQEYSTDLSAIQKQALEKELDGILALRLAEEAEDVFQVIAGWYRDLQLMQCKGDLNLLIHHDRQKELEQAFEHQAFQPLENVQRIMNDAKLALERSTSLEMILENIFLKLNCV